MFHRRKIDFVVSKSPSPWILWGPKPHSSYLSFCLAAQPNAGPSETPAEERLSDQFFLVYTAAYIRWSSPITKKNAAGDRVSMSLFASSSVWSRSIGVLACLAFSLRQQATRDIMSESDARATQEGLSRAMFGQIDAQVCGASGSVPAEIDA